MAVLEMKGKEPVAIKVIDSDPGKVAKAILPYHREGTVHVGYEAGCMGYTLYRLLTGMKIDCHIIAPNKVFRGGNREKIKTDKRDATAIAWMLRREEGGGWIPRHRTEGNPLTAETSKGRVTYKDHLFQRSVIT